MYCHDFLVWKVLDRQCTFMFFVSADHIFTSYFAKRSYSSTNKNFKHDNERETNKNLSLLNNRSVKPMKTMVLLPLLRLCMNLLYTSPSRKQLFPNSK